MRRVFSILLCAAVALLAAAAPATSGGQRPRNHVVYAGQTLAMIAKRYNVSVEALCAANGISRRSPLKPGRRLAIPQVGETPADAAAARATPPSPAPKVAARPTREAPRAKGRPAAEDVDSAAAYVRRPKRRGYLQLVSFVGAYRGQALDRRGVVTDAARRAISKVLAAWRTGAELNMDARLVRLMVEVSDHFGGRPLRVVSGFRPWTPTQYTAHSRHNKGQAVDFSIPGVPNSVLRDYCRSLPNVGCGYYPNSSFVHMDARESSAYWVDFAGPGEAPRYAGSDGKDPGRPTRPKVAKGDDDREDGDLAAADHPDEDPPESAAPAPAAPESAAPAPAAPGALPEWGGSEKTPPSPAN